MWDKDDLRLTLTEKLNLIRDIEFWQRQRWRRLKKFHSFTNIDMKTRHFFMREVIKLIRSQKERLLKLKQSTEQ